METRTVAEYLTERDKEILELAKETMRQWSRKTQELLRIVGLLK